jgi:phage portal protein BeeE
MSKHHGMTMSRRMRASWSGPNSQEKRHTANHPDSEIISEPNYEIKQMKFGEMMKI